MASEDYVDAAIGTCAKLAEDNTFTGINTVPDLTGSSVGGQIANKNAIDSVLPTIVSGDAGKMLMVNSGETGVEWKAKTSLKASSLASLGDTVLDGFLYAMKNMSAGCSIEATTITDGTNSCYAVEINARQMLTPPLSGRYYFQCNGTINIGANFYNLYQMDINTVDDKLTFYYINGTSASNVGMYATSVSDGYWLHYE